MAGASFPLQILTLVSVSSDSYTARRSSGGNSMKRGKVFAWSSLRRRVIKESLSLRELRSVVLEAFESEDEYAPTSVFSTVSWKSFGKAINIH